jgi:hypothetical protein
MEHYFRVDELIHEVSTTTISLQESTWSLRVASLCGVWLLVPRDIDRPLVLFHFHPSVQEFGGREKSTPQIDSDF